MSKSSLVLALFLTVCACDGALAQLAKKAAARPIEVSTLPEGFAESIVTTGLDGATALEIAPDGRVFIAEQTGAVRVVENGRLLDEPFVQVEVDSWWERGVIGVTVDPDFPRTPFVYLCTVAATPYPHHRISRWTADGNRAVAGSEHVLLEGDDQRTLGGSVPAGHQGGGIRFGADRKLYVGIGEQTAGLPSQSLGTLQGKLLRIGADGSIPDDNPFVDRTTGKYRSIWALGLRNPFALAVQPSTGRIYINDVGAQRFEEINEAIRGANYGWPATEGPTASEGHTAPIHAYSDAPMQSISGGVFYEPAHPTFPEEYHGKYFFADYILGWIRVLDPIDPLRATPFASGLFGPVDLRVAPDGSLWVLQRNAWIKDKTFQSRTGSLHRIFHVEGSGEPAPRVLIRELDQTAVAGRDVELEVEAHGEPPLRYEWRRGSERVDGALSPRLLVRAVRPEDDGATYTCLVSNDRGTTRSPPVRLRVSRLRAPDSPRTRLPGLERRTLAMRTLALPEPAALQDAPREPIGRILVLPHAGATATAGEIEGFLVVPEDDAYTFRIRTSGIAKLIVGAEEIAVATRGSTRRSTLALAAGPHSLRLIYAFEGSAPLLSVTLASGRMPEKEPDSSAFIRIDRSVLVEPSIHLNATRADGPIVARIDVPTLHAVIRTTTDGSDPDVHSSVYEHPIVISRSTVLRAAAFTDGSASAHRSKVVSSMLEIDGERAFGLSARPEAMTVACGTSFDELPRRLSSTGLFRDLARLEPSSGVIEYEINAASWLDGAASSRFLALPVGARIEIASDGSWRYPIGTVFAQHIEFRGNARSANSTDGADGGTVNGRADSRPIETRVLVVSGDRDGFGATYRWKSDGSDATLVTSPVLDTIPSSALDGSSRPWTYPGPADCQICHASNAGFVLGARPDQLHLIRRFAESGVVDEQLRAWSHVGILEPALDARALAAQPRAPNPRDGALPLEARVRSYLDANCAHCHRPDGVRGAYDARSTTPLEAQNIIDMRPIATDLGIPDARIVARGSPERSLLLARLGRRGDVYAMPPLGSHVPDTDAVELIDAWIRSLASVPASPSKGTR
jgi:glucose/arabinose dehydrogenase